MATQSAQVTAQPRNQLGSRANKRLRDTGLLPGVIYGHKEAVIPVTLPKKEVVIHLNKGTHLFDLALGDKSEKVLVKEVQYDHLGSEVIHIDFARVSLDEKVACCSRFSANSKSSAWLPISPTSSAPMSPT
jgi:large subunit ribosomal protein L25